MTRIILKNSNVANKRPDPASLADGEVAINTTSVSPGLFFKDSAGGLVKAGPTAYGTTAPNSTPASDGFAGNYTGELWYDSTVGVLKIYTGSNWVPTYYQTDLVGLTDGGKTSLGVGANTSAGSNVAIGVNAGATNASNGMSVNIGYNAKSGGSASVVIGYQACESGSNVSGGNVFVGYQAGQSTNVSNATVFGYQAGMNLQATSVAFGYQALMNATKENTAVGTRALKSMTTGSSNCALGTDALTGIATGSSNVAFGEQSGAQLTGGSSNNTFFGHQSGFKGDSNNNICIGFKAGYNTTGYGNVLIGNDLSDLGSLEGCVIIGKPNENLGSSLTRNVIICDVNGNIRLRFNENGALQMDGSYGAAGSVLVSQGTGAPPKWTTGATGSFVDNNGNTIYVEGGVITAVS